MSDDAQTSFCGCLILTAIVLLIGVGLRVQNFTQFLVIGAEVIVGLLALLWSINSLSNAGCWNRLLGLWLGFVTVVLAMSVGNFLITGDYDRSIEIAQRIWKQATPTPAASAQSEATPAPTPTPTLTPTPQSTSSLTPTPQPTSVLTPASTSSALTTGPEVDDWPWLSEAEVSGEQVTETLNEIWGLSAQDAAKTADRLRVAKETASDEGKPAAGLLIAVALERSEVLSTAHAAYEQVINEAEDTPFATSAAFRLRLLEDPETGSEGSETAEELNFFQRLFSGQFNNSTESDSDDVETIYETIVDEPEVEGWFLLSDQWGWNTTRHAALQSLVNLRTDQLSFRFFQFLRSQSPFPTPYAYLFILLALTISVKLLALPLYIRASKLAIQVRQLQSELQAIQNLYGDDPIVVQQQTMELYKERGLNIWGGCALGIVDPIFVIWALVALSSFSPQLILDGSQFLWVSDVVQYNFGIILAWMVISFIGSMIIGASQRAGISAGQLVFSILFGNLFFMGIAWYWSWPAYVFIFWILLSIVGLVINRILLAIQMVIK